MRQDEAQGASTTLANFVAGTAWADVAAQNHEAKRSILNFFATALGSANDPAVSGALRALLPFSGAVTSAVIGRPERLDAMGAAFVNAISANLLDFDDMVYGRHVRVDFLHKLRDEEKYADLATLTRQIAIDVENVRTYFERRRADPAKQAKR